MKDLLIPLFIAIIVTIISKLLENKLSSMSSRKKSDDYLKQIMMKLLTLGAISVIFYQLYLEVMSDDPIDKFSVLKMILLSISGVVLMLLNLIHKIWVFLGEMNEVQKESLSIVKDSIQSRPKQ
ncbi:hypothetical protein J7X40_003369 [Vibrio parahaemolyticus]|nr:MULTISPECIES: hypothetical protein [Vibrio harveyi group]EHH2533904.1 hypothetical protein [Vibrio parahaemolyticus]EHZ2540325.1 hypothetical protein [Vibrio parahaemolyticus]MBS9967065.1 hypothetical protein [Vibrio alginolyticus]MCR9880513.1 hypothetical protein [Vibrio parahaemolyticus]MCR9893740.1 hypothetical protein [Vibrio parahaemolyticus]